MTQAIDKLRQTLKETGHIIVVQDRATSVGAKRRSMNNSGGSVKVLKQSRGGKVDVGEVDRVDFGRELGDGSVVNTKGIAEEPKPNDLN